MSTVNLLCPPTSTLFFIQRERQRYDRFECQVRQEFNNRHFSASYESVYFFFTFVKHYILLTILERYRLIVECEKTVLARSHVIHSREFVRVSIWWVKRSAPQYQSNRYRPKKSTFFIIREQIYRWLSIIIKAEPVDQENRLYSTRTRQRERLNFSLLPMTPPDELVDRIDYNQSRGHSK